MTGIWRFIEEHLILDMRYDFSAEFTPGWTPNKSGGVTLTPIYRNRQTGEWTDDVTMGRVQVVPSQLLDAASAGYLRWTDGGKQPVGKAGTRRLTVTTRATQRMAGRVMDFPDLEGS